MTHSVSDDVAGAWPTLHIQVGASNRYAGIAVYPNHPGGNVTVTITTSGDMVLFGQVSEWRGVAVDPVRHTGALATGSTSSPGTFYAAPSSGFSPLSGSLILASYTLSASVTTVTPGANYTLARSAASYTNGGGTLHQYRIAPSNLTDERPEITFTAAAARQCGAVCIELIEASDASVRAGINRGLVNQVSGLVRGR